MTSPEGIQRQADLLARVRALRARRDTVVAQVNAELRQAIIEARDAGAQVKDIAAASGWSRQYISDIYNNQS